MELMSTSENKVLGRSRNMLTLFHDFSALTSSIIGLGDAYHQYAADRLDVKIRSERLVSDVRQRAARAAGTAAAIFSSAAIDASSGTARARVAKLIDEGNREVAGILGAIF